MKQSAAEKALKELIREVVREELLKDKVQDPPVQIPSVWVDWRWYRPYIPHYGTGDPPYWQWPTTTTTVSNTTDLSDTTWIRASDPTTATLSMTMEATNA